MRSASNRFTGSPTPLAVDVPVLRMNKNLIKDLYRYIWTISARDQVLLSIMMDDSYQLFRDWYGVSLDARPSEIISQHFWFGIIRDPLAIQLRDHLPVDRLMWGSDFPHSVTSYPDTREWIERIFAGAPSALRRKILLETPCEFFDLDPTAELTPTPA